MSQYGPFPWRRQADVDSAIKELKRRSMQSFRHNIKCEDLQVLLTKPADRPILQRAADIMAGGFYNSTYLLNIPHGEYANVQVYLEIPSTGHKVLLPNYVNTEGFQPDIPDELRERVHGAMTRLIKNDMDWRYVKAVTDVLMNRCQTAAQVKLYMPTIVTLFRTGYVNGYEGDNDYADRIYGLPMPKDVPALPPLLRKWAADVGMTVTRASMLPITPEVKQADDDFIFRAVVKDEIRVPWGDAKLPEV